MFGQRFWLLVAALLVVGAGYVAIKESYLQGWGHGYVRAKCDYTGDECPGIDEMGAPR